MNQNDWLSKRRDEWITIYLSNTLFAGAAAGDAAGAAQEQHLRKMLIAGIETGDTK